MNPIDRALDNIRTYGWVKYELYTVDGARCMIGGFVNPYWQVAGRRRACQWPQESALLLVASTIREQYPDFEFCCGHENPIYCHQGCADEIIADFNNSDYTTWEMCEAVLEKASQKYDEVYA